MRNNFKLLWIVCTLGLLSQCCNDDTPNDTPDTDHPGSSSDACQFPGYVNCKGSCIDPASSSQYCGANEQCENYKVCGENEACRNGKCEPTSLCTHNKCAPDEYCSEYGCTKIDTCTRDKCEGWCGDFKNDPKHCGNCNTDCTRIETSTGVCKDGKCEFKDASCNPPCKENQTCRNGECICSESDHVLCNDTCIYPLESHEYCGANEYCENYETCSIDETCQYGVCEIIKCPKPDKEHLYMGTCEPDDVNNCGKHGYECKREVVGWLEGECVEGGDTPQKAQCYVKKCTDNYLLIKGKCELESKEHCGDNNLNCLDMTGWEDAQCVNHSCVATKCIQNYHLYR